MGFETIVRPVVLPNIRPQPWRTRSVSSPSAMARAIPDAPEGFAVIRGNPATQVNLTNSTSISISRNQGQEKQRRVDLMRVYHKDDDGTVSKDNFIDVEVANRMKMKDGFGDTTNWFRRAPEADNIERLKKDLIYNTGTGG